MVDNLVNQLANLGLGATTVASSGLVGKLGVSTLNTGVIRAGTHLEFPLLGDSNTIYIAVEENATYRWDDEKLLYFCIGRDYKEIELIDGGNA